MMMTRYLSLFLLSAMLVACDGDRPNAGSSGNDGNAGTGAALPVPQAASGSITGMPDAPPIASASPPGDASSVPIEPVIAPIDEVPAEAGGETDTPTAVDTEAAGADAAVQVIRDYYAAINRRDYANAYRLWRGGGQASGQSAAQFAAGFADTSGVSVEIGEPGRIDAGAGQRHIEVPVSLTARHADGSQQRFRGRYVLQRTVVDGASADQRAWRIGSASLGEVR